MKVFENIERFVRESGEFGQPKAVSDEEFRQGLKKLVESVIPLRKEEGKCISTYNKVRDELPMTSYIAEKESCFGDDISLGQRVVDSAMLKVIYDDRYSFGFLYWDLIKKYDYLDMYKDPEAPYRKGLIEYAVDFDLEETVEGFWKQNLNDRLAYAEGKLRKSKLRVLIHHQIKVDYESALSTMINNSREDSAIELGSEPIRDKGAVMGGINPHFEYLIIKKKYKKELMAFLHEGIDGNTGAGALVYLQAAIDAGLVDKPTFKEMTSEFGDITKRSNYSALVGPPGQGTFVRKQVLLAQLTEELREKFK